MRTGSDAGTELGVQGLNLTACAATDTVVLMQKEV